MDEVAVSQETGEEAKEQAFSAEEQAFFEAAFYGPQDSSCVDEASEPKPAGEKTKEQTTTAIRGGGAKPR